MPNGFEAFKLKLETKIYRYRFNMRRFGPVLFFGAKLTRRLGLRALHEPMRRRMNEIHQAQLK